MPSFFCWLPQLQAVLHFILQVHCLPGVLLLPRICIIIWIRVNPYPPPPLDFRIPLCLRGLSEAEERAFTLYHGPTTFPSPGVLPFIEANASENEVDVDPAEAVMALQEGDGEVGVREDSG